MPKADHPLLDDLLKDTLGVVLYQDHVLEVAIEMCGFTPGQADQFRRSMSRKRSRAAMERFRNDFIEGASRKGVSQRNAGDVFDKLCAFSEFGFPKSHAYAFAVLAYQSAWLRHYYGAEYYAAPLNNQPMGFYAPHVLIGDARRQGLQVLRVSLNRSAARAKPVIPDQILLGFETVRGIGEDLAKAIVAERELHGPYRSLPDLLRRTGMPRNAAEHLISVGALVEGTVQFHSGTLNVIAKRVTPLSELTTGSVALPRAPERNSIPGYSHDPREEVSRELALAAPASRDFH